MKKEFRNKGGRPKTEVPKNCYITASFTSDEFRKIVTNSTILGITKSEYVANITLNGFIQDTYSPRQKDLVLRLINISNNINQIAKAANTVGFSQIVLETDSLLAEIRKLINTGR